MTAWLQAAAALADTLDAENAALEALDMNAAARLLERKRAALSALHFAPPALRGAPQDAAPLLRAATERLAEAAARNKRLLERAIAVQGQVIGKLVGAVARAAPAARYGACGRQIRLASPIAVRARI